MTLRCSTPRPRSWSPMHAPDLRAGVELAGATLDNGAAERALEALVRVSCEARDAEAEA